MWHTLKSVFLAIPKGMSITFRYLLRKPVTEQYPNKTGRSSKIVTVACII